MLPDRSTASIRFRPDTGTSSSSPMRSGRAAASTSKIQAITAIHIFQLSNCSACDRSARTAKPPKLGTLSPASCKLDDSGKKRLINIGNGSASKTQGQARDHISLLPLPVLPPDDGRQPPDGPCRSPATLCLDYGTADRGFGGPGRC